MARHFRQWILIAIGVLTPESVAAQQAAEWTVGAGLGGTYYCLVSRCGTGTVLVGKATYGPFTHVGVEGGVRWHHCFDCDRFLVLDGNVHVRYPGRTVAPFLALGVGVSSDPSFMGTHVGLLAAAGAWIWFSGRWGVQLEARGRQVGEGDHLGEASLVLTRRFPGKRS